MATAGPKGPATGANDAAIGTTAWSSPGNITTEDAAGALNTGTSGSNYLKGTNFGFTSGDIPSGATINGIQVEWKCLVDSTAGGEDMRITSVKLVVGGSITGNDLQTNQQINVTSYTYFSYGGVSELWGLTPTQAQVTASDFGAVLQVTRNGGIFSARCDFVQITITYTAATGAAGGACLFLPGM